MLITLSTTLSISLALSWGRYLRIYKSTISPVRPSIAFFTAEICCKISGQSRRSLTIFSIPRIWPMILFTRFSVESIYSIYDLLAGKSTQKIIKYLNTPIEIKAIDKYTLPIVNIFKLKRTAKLFYKNRGMISCPILNNPVRFTSEGFNHLLYENYHHPRKISEQYLKMMCLFYAPEVIKKCSLISETRKIQRKIKGKYREVIH